MRRSLLSSSRSPVHASALALLLALVFTLVCTAQSGVVVRPDPVELGVQSEAEGTVTLLFENVQDLYGLEVHLSFDPSIVEVVDADAAKPGVQVQPADWLRDGFVGANLADNAAGKIDFAATLVNPAPPISGSQGFATITFRAKADGVSPLTIDTVLLATRDADVIESQVQNGRIGVSADGTFRQPEPSPPAATAEPAASGSPTPATTESPLLAVAAFLSIVAFLAAVLVLVYAIRSGRRGRPQSNYRLK